MKPYVFSKKKYELEYLGWHQGGKNAFFGKKPLRFKFLEDKVYVPKLYTMVI